MVDRGRLAGWVGVLIGLTASSRSSSCSLQSVFVACSATISRRSPRSTPLNGFAVLLLRHAGDPASRGPARAAGRGRDDGGLRRAPSAWGAGELARIVTMRSRVPLDRPGRDLAAILVRRSGSATSLQGLEGRSGDHDRISGRSLERGRVRRRANRVPPLRLRRPDGRAEPRGHRPLADAIDRAQVPYRAGRRWAWNTMWLLPAWALAVPARSTSPSAPALNAVRRRRRR